MTEMVASRVEEGRDSQGIYLKLNFGGSDSSVELEIARSPSGSFAKRREFVISLIVDACMEAVSLHSCEEQVVEAVHGS